MNNQLIQIIFEANLSFSALLLAVMGILVALYVRATHPDWKFKLKVLLVFCGAAFLLAIFNCMISLLHLLDLFPNASANVFNLIIALFFCEVAILTFAGLFLIITVVSN